MRNSGFSSRISPCSIVDCANKKASASFSDRRIWLRYMDEPARPLLSNLAQDKLKQNMPVRLPSPGFQ